MWRTLRRGGYGRAQSQVGHRSARLHLYSPSTSDRSMQPDVSTSAASSARFISDVLRRGASGTAAAAATAAPSSASSRASASAACAASRPRAALRCLLELRAATRPPVPSVSSCARPRADAAARNARSGGGRRLSLSAAALLLGGARPPRGAPGGSASSARRPARGLPASRRRRRPRRRRRLPPLRRAAAASPRCARRRGSTPRTRRVDDAAGDLRLFDERAEHRAVGQAVVVAGEPSSSPTNSTG